MAGPIQHPIDVSRTRLGQWNGACNISGRVFEARLHDNRNILRIMHASGERRLAELGLDLPAALAPLLHAAMTPSIAAIFLDRYA